MDDSAEALRGPSEMDEVYLSEDAGADVAQDVGDNGEDPDVQMADDDEAERDHIAAEDGDTEQAQEPTEQDPHAEEEDAEEGDTEAGEQQEGEGRRDNVLEISQEEVRAVSVLSQLLTGVTGVNMNLIAPFAPENFRSGLGALCEEYGVQIPSSALDGLHRVLLPLVTRLNAMKQRLMTSREQQEACPVDVRGMLQRIIREHDGPTDAGPGDAASPSAQAASAATSEPASAAAAAAAAAASSNAASSSTEAAPAAARAMPMLPSRPTRRAAASARAANPAASGPDVPVQGDSLEAVYGADEGAKTKAKRRELQDMRVCVNLLAQRLGVPLNGSFLHQVINRINVAENIKFPPSSSHRGHVERVMRLATAEAEEKLAELPSSEPIPGFEVTVLVLGMTGVGKTMMINRLLGREPMEGVDAFGRGTQSVKVIRGVIRGVQFKFIDTPGLSTCSSAVGSNQRKLVVVKRMLRSNPADTMLFVDRIDAHRRSNPEQAVLSMVLEVLGKPLLYRSCMVLTHGASAPPETPNGQMSYELWSQQSVHRMQMMLRQATHDPRIMVPVMPVENHPNCRTNAAGEPVLPNGMAWRTQLLVVCCGSKVLEKTEKVVMMTSRKKAPASTSVNLPPIPWILGQMSQGKPPKKLPEEERDIVDLESIKKMPHDEGREAKRRRQEFVRQRREEEQSAGDEQVLIPAPDPPVPPTFDGAPTLHRYRYLESGAGWVVRPFVEQQSMDHDDGVHGAHVERQYTLRRRGQYLGGVPGHFLMQVQKDKDHTMLVVDTESSAFTSRNGCVSLASNAQTLGSDMAYTLRLEPRWKYHQRAKSSAGLIWSRLGENRSLLKGIVANGFRLEQRIRIKSGVKLLGTFSRIGYRRKHAPMTMPGLMGMMGSMGGKKGEVGWSTGLELHCKAGKGANDPSVVAGLSLMMWRRSLNLGLNLAGQCDVTPETIGTCRLTINNRSQGSLTLRVTSHDQPKLGWGMLVPALGFLGQKLLNRGELVL